MNTKSILPLYPYFQNSFTQSSRIIHTPSTFARSTLFYLQEVGELRALLPHKVSRPHKVLRPHVSSRDSLDSYLFFVIVAG